MYTYIVSQDLKVSMYNRTFAKGMLDVKVVKVSLTYSSNISLDLRTIGGCLAQAISLLDTRQVIQKDDPFLIHLLEPRTGATVHNLLNDIRAMEESYRVLGDTVPPDTINGYRVVVFNPDYYVTTLEGLAKFIRENLGSQFTADDRVAITIEDGGFAVVY